MFNLSLCKWDDVFLCHSDCRWDSYANKETKHSSMLVGTIETLNTDVDSALVIVSKMAKIAMTKRYFLNRLQPVAK